MRVVFFSLFEQLEITYQGVLATVCLLGFGLAPLGVRAQAPYGLDGRSPIGPYLNGVMPPKAGAFAFPPVLSATGAFRDLKTLTPADGVIPYTVNSPLWSDGAIKSRWIAVPNDGAPYSANELIGFTPVGEWTFPDGTVFVKQFDLNVNEATGERRRLETRFLVRSSDGRYAVTYKWRPDQSDADLLADGFNEDITITTAGGATRIQRYSYPSRSDCLYCHNRPASYVLGLKTHQLNGDFTYPSTGRTDNQLRTFIHLGLLNPAPGEDAIPSYLHSVPVTNSSATVQHRMRSWIDANCSQCHRPGGFGPGFDARFYTPLESQNLIGTYLKFRDVAGSQIYQRDNALDESKMPPLAKNLVHEDAMTNLRQWIASPLELLSVYSYQDTRHLAVRFNSHVNPETATIPSNYSLDRGATVLEALPASDPDTIILTVSPLELNQNYLLTATGVQDTAVSANTIWPGSGLKFIAQYPPVPTSTRLVNIAARLQTGPGDEVAIIGFIVRGASAKRMIIRARGPSLNSNGIANGLPNPTLDIHDQTGTLIATNDNWIDNANQQEIIDTGLAPAFQSESVVLTRFPSDENRVSFTAILHGTGNDIGIGLLEVYDLDRDPGSELLNISARGRVGTGDGVLIGGFIISGTNSRRVIVRGIGPSLSVKGQLSDPALELRDGNGALLEANDNWRDSPNKQAVIDSTIPPGDPLESAIVRTLGPGNYTAIVRGVNNTTGIAVVEIYALN